MEDTEQTSEETQKREQRLLNSVCSFQSRLGPPEYRRWRRMHGLQLPLHPMQIAGWLVFISVAVATFLILVPTMTGVARQSLLVALSTLFILHLISHLAAVLIDPADPALRAIKIRTVPEFDRSKHAHVIENGRCHLCNIPTNSPQTKHCSVCNKCVDHFDHHCKWLNHCIGGRNYIAFIVCVVSAVLASLVVVATAVTELAYYHLHPNLLEVSSPDLVFLLVVGGLGVIALVSAALLLHLCLFHCYISILGITTYEYIRNYRAGKANRCPQLREGWCLLRKRKVSRTLKRQDTDPEFIDRVAKPYVVPMPEEERFTNAPISHTMRELLKLCPKKLTLDISHRNSLTNGKVKNNQVRPTTDEDLTRALEKLTDAAHAVHEPIMLPVLRPATMRSDSQLHLQQLRSALDLAECGPLRPSIRRGFKTHPHTPSLSPIHESGLSNTNSPRLSTSQDIPRSSTPQVSTIFLSNPSTPCSSDEEETASPVTFKPGLVPEDVLQTPHMPRKVYSPKQVFVVRSSKLSVPQWSDHT